MRYTLDYVLLFTDNDVIGRKNCYALNMRDALITAEVARNTTDYSFTPIINGQYILLRMNKWIILSCGQNKKND